MENKSICWSEDAPVRIFPLQENGWDWTDTEGDSLSNSYDLLTSLEYAGYCLKTCRVSYHRITEELSAPFYPDYPDALLPPPVTDGVQPDLFEIPEKIDSDWHGELLTLNLPEFPDSPTPSRSEDAVCSLSDILVTGPVPWKYYLSAKCCAGILRRAERRGKKLPDMLITALKMQISLPWMQSQINSMKSGNPNSGFHKADVSKTLDTTVPTPQKSQGGQMVLTYQSGQEKESDVSCTLDVKCKDGMCRNQAGMAVVETGKGFFVPMETSGTLEQHEDQHRRCLICAPVASTLNTHYGDKMGLENQHVNEGCPLFVIENNNTDKPDKPNKQDRQDMPDRMTGNIAGTLEARHDSSPCADRGQNIVCVHGSQDPIWNSDHANAVNRNNGLENVIAYENHAQDSRVKELKDGVFQQLTARAGTGGRNLPLVQECYPINSMVIGKEAKDGDRQTTGIGNNGDPLPTIGTSQHHAVAICENLIGDKNGPNGKGVQEEVTYTQNASGLMGVSCNTTVRRLMPIECERLMGFPDNWTRIPWNGKPEEDCPDAPRYKACGNSMCVNVMRWIGMRIQKIEEGEN